MRNVVSAALAAATLTLGAPVAAAGAGYEYAGGCDFRAAPPIEGQTTSGALHALVVVYANEPTQNPVRATVTCSLRVNGAEVAAAAFAGTSVVTGVAVASYAASDTDSVASCETVELPDGVRERCRTLEQGGVVPQEVQDAGDAAYDFGVHVVQSLVSEFADPTVCPVLARFPGEWGLVDINPEGDVYVVGDPVWDCPPYGEARFPPRMPPPPPYYAGGITITNPGGGLVVQRTGVMAITAWWSCSQTSSSTGVTVTCNWLGGWFPPVCRKGINTAVALPTIQSSGAVTWGKVRTVSTCGGLSRQTATASAPPLGNAYKTFGPFWYSPYPYAWQVVCRAENGSGGPPVVAYVADCDYAF